METKLKEWQKEAINLKDKGTSWRQIAIDLKVPRSTVSDFLRKHESVSVNVPTASINRIATRKTGGGSTHFVITDSQVVPGLNLEYLEWIGKDIAHKRPDVIIHIGDFADMESLSSYDKGKRSAEGKRVFKDIEASIEGMKRLTKPIYDLQQAELREHGEIRYLPRMILTLGNHEFRIERHVDANPELFGLLSTDSLKYQEFGWEVYPFLEPVMVDGIAYCHYFQNNFTGKPLGGSALNMLKQIGTSFTQDHKQTLDVCTRFIQTTGDQQWGIIAGAGYIHDEHYKGVQGNRHWRGCIVKYNVHNGGYDPLFLSMSWLKKKYGKSNNSKRD